jgi:hypothetical protein
LQLFDGIIPALDHSESAQGPGGDDMNPASKRRAERRRVLRGGKIILSNLMSTYECKMRDLSATGALLIVNNATSIPDEFYLAVDFQTGRRPCHVAWRKMNQLGVEFLDK